MAETREKLLKNDAASFNQLYEETERQIKTLSRKNDQMNQLVDDSDDPAIMKQISALKKDILQILEQVKLDLDKLDRQSKAIDSKNKYKRVKEVYVKEQNRFNQLCKNLDKKSTQYPGSSTENRRKSDQEEFAQVQRILQHDSTFTNQVEMDNNILRQNQEDVDYIERNAAELQKCVKQLAEEVEHQDANLDIIDLNVNRAKVNVVAAGGELEKANEYSQSSRKWYLILLCLAVVLVIVLVLVLAHKQLGF